MPDTRLARTDALTHLALRARDDPGAKAILAHRPHQAMISLRGSGDAFGAAVEAALGCAIPPARRATQAGDWACAWLGPDEWLAIGPDGAQGAMVARLRAALEGFHAAVVDVSDNYTTIVVSGPAARDMIAGACPIDLHPRAFAPGQVVQSYFATVDVILRQVPSDDPVEDPAFHLTLRRSFADHVWRWLVDAAKPVGLRISLD